MRIERIFYFLYVFKTKRYILTRVVCWFCCWWWCIHTNVTIFPLFLFRFFVFFCPNDYNIFLTLAPQYCSTRIKVKNKKIQSKTWIKCGLNKLKWGNCGEFLIWIESNNKKLINKIECIVFFLFFWKCNTSTY